MHRQFLTYKIIIFVGVADTPTNNLNKIIKDAICFCNLVILSKFVAMIGFTQFHQRLSKTHETDSFIFAV
jgi:hypothetical protein